eukprot:gene32002-54414_t
MGWLSRLACLAVGRRLRARLNDPSARRLVRLSIVRKRAEKRKGCCRARAARDRGVVFVTRHSNVTSPELREKLWHLYELAYRPMATEAVTRETFYRHEFDELLSDPSNRLWVAWQDQDPVAAAMIATDIAATRYLSRTYFDHHYPEHSLRSVVHYILWVVVHPAHVATGTLVRLSKEAFALEADEGALLVFDVPQVHQPAEAGGVAEMMYRTGNMVSPGTE